MQTSDRDRSQIWWVLSTHFSLLKKWVHSSQNSLWKTVTALNSFLIFCSISTHVALIFPYYTHSGSDQTLKLLRIPYFIKKCSKTFIWEKLAISQNYKFENCNFRGQNLGVKWETNECWFFCSRSLKKWVHSLQRSQVCTYVCLTGF